MSIPFRADQVGSLLRPEGLAAERARFKRGEIDAAQLRAAEDRAITEAVRQQEAIGLQSITDGEFRRDWWHLDFLAQLDGVTLKENPGPKFQTGEHGGEQPPIATVTGKIGCSRPIMADDFAYLKIADHAHAEDDDPVAVDAAPARRPRGHLARGLSRHGRLLGRRGRGLPRGHRPPVRRRLPLPAAGRHHLRLPVRPEDPGQLPRQRRRPGRAAADLCRHHQCRAGRQAGRPARDHPHLPRQLQERLGGRRRLRPGGAGDVLDRTSTATSWSSTACAPAASSPCAPCPRARRWCWGW